MCTGPGAGQVQRGSGEGSEGWEAWVRSQVSSGEGSRKPWCKAKSSSTGSGEGSGEGSRKLWQAKSSSRVLEKVAEKVPEKVLGIFGAGPGHVQKRLWRSLFFLPSLHASERVVKIKRAAVGDTTEAFFHFSKTFLFFSSFKL